MPNRKQRAYVAANISRSRWRGNWNCDGDVSRRGVLCVRASTPAAAAAGTPCRHIHARARVQSRAARALCKTSPRTHHHREKEAGRMVTRRRRGEKKKDKNEGGLRAFSTAEASHIGGAPEAAGSRARGLRFPRRKARRRSNQRAPSCRPETEAKAWEEKRGGQREGSTAPTRRCVLRQGANTRAELAARALSVSAHARAGGAASRLSFLSSLPRLLTTIPGPCQTAAANGGATEGRERAENARRGGRKKGTRAGKASPPPLSPATPPAAALHTLTRQLSRARQGRSRGGALYFHHGASPVRKSVSVQALSSTLSASSTLACARASDCFVFVAVCVVLMLGGG